MLCSHARQHRHCKAFEHVRRGYYPWATLRLHRALQQQLNLAVEGVGHMRRPQEFPARVADEIRRSEGVYERGVTRVHVQVAARFGTRVLRTLGGGQAQQGAFQQAARQEVHRHAGTLIQAPNRTTQRRLVAVTERAVNRGLARGWSNDRIAAEIQRRSGPAVGRVRAAAIARTEVTRASNFGSLAAARRSRQRLRKQWVTVLDGHERATHAAAHTQTVHLSQPFVVGGFPAMYPAAPTLPAREVANCRCTLAYVRL